MSLEELGASLRSRREGLHLRLDQVSEQTKIHVRHLRALEAGDVTALPGRVYARSFLKHYARVLGLDPEEVVAAFDAAAAPYVSSRSAGQASSRRQRRARRARPDASPRIAWQWVGVAVFLGLVGFLVANALDANDERVQLNSQAVQLTELPTPEEVRTEPDEMRTEPDEMPGAAPFVGDLGPTPGGVGESAPAVISGGAAPLDGGGVVDREVAPDEEGVPEESDAPAEVEPTLAEPAPLSTEGGRVGPDQAEGAAQPAPEAAIDTAGQAVVEAVVEAPAGEAETQPVAQPGVVLDVEVLRASWFEVTADGNPLYIGVLEDGTQVRWTAEGALRVRYGRPEGLRITLNGTYIGAPGTGVITRVYTPDGVLESGN